MRILIADKFPTKSLDAFKALGMEVDYRPELDAQSLAGAVGGASVLVVRSTEVRADVFERGASLNLVVRAGAGTNTIDRKAASARGVYVANCPGKNSIAVAELVFALLLAIDRRVVENVADLRAGKWNKKEYGKANGLFGRTMGVAGLGSIGREVALRARAFGMEVVGWSRSLGAERARELGIERAATLGELAGRCDALSLHLPLSQDTRGLVGEEVLGRLRPGAILINTSRGELVDAAALRRAVLERGLRVGLDVFHQEPEGGSGAFADPIAQLPGVYGTHHIGASTEQAQEAIADETVRIVASFLSAGLVPNSVNVAARSPAKWQLIVRHLDRVGVLAQVLNVLKRHEINVEEMENTIFDGALAACCKIKVDSRPAPELLAEIRNPEEIIHVDLVELS
jgi:D-3-phosphoglycerate dehydrogenase / 2-oxoglutarate reductase